MMASQISVNSIILNVSNGAYSLAANGSQDHDNDNSAGIRLSSSPLNGLDDVNNRGVFPTSDNVKDSVVCPSPDEIVIKGRGRRSLPLKWSPIPIESPKKPLSAILSISDRTPKKGLVTLRSSPRKRLQLNDPSLGELTSSRKSLLKTSPLMKKHSGVLPENTFNKLSQKQLVNILDTVLRNHPEIRGEVVKILPEPPLKIVEQINEIHKSVMQAIPNDTIDNATFCKVMPQLSHMKKLISEHCQHLAATEQWPALLEFVFFSWSYIKETPMLDSDMHLNYARTPCFKLLAKCCSEALLNMNIKEPSLMESILNRLEGLAIDYPDIKNSIGILKQ